MKDDRWNYLGCYFFKIRLILNLRYAFSGRIPESRNGQALLFARLDSIRSQTRVPAAASAPRVFSARNVSKAPQNSSSSVTLVLCPSIMIDRLKTAEIMLS